LRTECQRAAQKKSEKALKKYAVHIGGQELGMHDPKLTRPGRLDAARYLMDATPGRHTQNSGPNSFKAILSIRRTLYFRRLGGANLLGLLIR